MPTVTTRRRRLLRLLSSAGLLLALSAACTFDDGERATTGDCPAGEVCSDRAPRGLTFYGNLLGDDLSSSRGLLPLALGGSQNLGWATNEGTLGEVAAESDAPWLVTVQPTDETRDAQALFFGDDARRLDGLAEGEAHLRITDASTGELLDRATVRVARTARVDAVIDGAEAPGELTRGAVTSVTFRLFDGTDARLIDEGLTVTSAEAELDRTFWDTVELTVPTDAAEVSFTISAGHRRWAVTLPVR